MDELMKQETMSSLLIAEICGKSHNDVLKAIRKMEDAWHKVCGRKFSLTSQLIEMRGLKPTGRNFGSLDFSRFI